MVQAVNRRLNVKSDCGLVQAVNQTKCRAKKNYTEFLSFDYFLPLHDIVSIIPKQ